MTKQTVVLLTFYYDFMVIFLIVVRFGLDFDFGLGLTLELELGLVRVWARFMAWD